jgi:hypothetical protein
METNTDQTERVWRIETGSSNNTKGPTYSKLTLVITVINIIKSKQRTKKRINKMSNDVESANDAICVKT